MRVIFVDDEESAQKVFEYETKKIQEIEIVGKFTSGEEALEFAYENVFDIAFLDIEMKDMDGIALGNLLRKIHPELMLIYITGHEKYAMEAIRLHVAAYLLKPYSREELLYAIETARLLSKRSPKRFFARTFGHFDFFVDGAPIMFHSAKAKELLALLIDRQGGTVTTEQIISILWENRPNDEATQNLCSKVGRTLVQELAKHDVKDLVITRRGIRRVDTSLFDCDLYDFLEDTSKTENSFQGEYMLEYSWGESKTALLCNIVKNRAKQNGK